MCLGIPAQVTGRDAGHEDLVFVEMGGIARVVNAGLLDEERPLAAGAWVLVHMGFALQVITAEEAAEAIAALGAERAAEARWNDAVEVSGDS